MIKKYYLNTESLPVIPTPHDWVINKIEANSEFLIFYLEDTGINYNGEPPHDFAPNSKSLIMRLHLEDPVFEAYKWKKSVSGKGFFEIDANKLLAIPKKHTLEYLYHYVGYNTIIIKLYQLGHILLDISADYVELEWL
ncbi:MAG: hypothetical protein K2O28_05485 [Clostridia bacterium]|nr:hypothetical protein [Clostridia bacterium]